MNAKVIEVVNKTKSETVYILNDKKYLPDDKLPRKLTQRMTKFGSKIENKLRSALTEIQQENKDTAMHFIRDIDRYLKVYRAWKENKTAKFFFRLENEAWWANGRINTWISHVFECDGGDDGDGEFYFE